MEAVFTKLNHNYEIIFCLDPSPDNTEQIILEEIKRNDNTVVVSGNHLQQ
jgi:dolichol-phosphate mannosyltransferase